MGNPNNPNHVRQRQQYTKEQTLEDDVPFNFGEESDFSLQFDSANDKFVIQDANGDDVFDVNSDGTVNLSNALTVPDLNVSDAVDDGRMRPTMENTGTGDADLFLDLKTGGTGNPAIEFIRDGSRAMQFWADGNGLGIIGPGDTEFVKIFEPNGQVRITESGELRLGTGGAKIYLDAGEIKADDDAGNTTTLT